MSLASTIYTAWALAVRSHSPPSLHLCESHARSNAACALFALLSVPCTSLHLLRPALRLHAAVTLWTCAAALAFSKSCTSRSAQDEPVSDSLALLHCISSTLPLVVHA